MPGSPSPTYRRLAQEAVRRLREAGDALTDTPELDASLLLARAAGIDRSAVIARYPDPVPADAAARFRGLLERRLSGTPVAYLLERKEFWGLEFAVNGSVLIPRPDTETLVEKALEAAARLRAQGKTDAPGILDLCCGSGCVGIALAAELPGAAVVLSDVSPEALEVARGNIGRLLPGAAESGRVRAVQGDLFAPFGPEDSFDLIVTNPPYLTDGETDEMFARGWAEPESALRGGADGLDLVRTIVKEGFAFLAPGGYLLIESASSQTAGISRMLEARGYREISVARDLAGRERVTSGARYQAC